MGNIKMYNCACLFALLEPSTVSEASTSQTTVTTPVPATEATTNDVTRTWTGDNTAVTFTMTPENSKGTESSTEISLRSITAETNAQWISTTDTGSSASLASHSAPQSTPSSGEIISVSSGITSSTESTTDPITVATGSIDSSMTDAKTVSSHVSSNTNTDRIVTTSTTTAGSDNSPSNANDITTQMTSVEASSIRAQDITITSTSSDAPQLQGRTTTAVDRVTTVVTSADSSQNSGSEISGTPADRLVTVTGSTFDGTSVSAVSGDTSSFAGTPVSAGRGDTHSTMNALSISSSSDDDRRVSVTTSSNRLLDSDDTSFTHVAETSPAVETGSLAASAAGGAPTTLVPISASVPHTSVSQVFSTETVTVLSGTSESSDAVTIPSLQTVNDDVISTDRDVSTVEAIESVPTTADDEFAPSEGTIRGKV